MAKPNDEMDIRTEMRIALFWRGLIGDGRYNKLDPEDCIRWYQALELRGPQEIRAVKNERYFTVQNGVMQGVVNRAPHPPLWLVNEWLEHYEQQVHTGSYWAAAAGIVVMIGLVFGNLQGCTNLSTMNQLAMNPPSPSVAVTPYSLPGSSPLGMYRGGIGAYAPNTAMAPSAPTATGPQSNGIAGAANGMVPATGATGAQNTGASLGATQGGSSPP